MANEQIPVSPMDVFKMWNNNGTVDKLYESYKKYAQSDEYNDYRGTVLLESARKNKEVLGLTDAEIDAKPIFAQTLVTAAKLAEYAAKGTSKAIANQDQEMMNTIQKRHITATNTLNALANSEDRENFIASFIKVASLEKGKSQTLGETTSMDKGITHEVGAWDELMYGLKDASVIIGAGTAMFSSEADKEIDATNRELMRTTDTGSMGVVASVIGTVGAFVAESALLSGGIAKMFGTSGKAASLGSKAISSKKLSEYARYTLQGAVLPMLQNANENSGLTEQYHLFSTNNLGEQEELEGKIGRAHV